jgi:O-antigen/teichoic acid export membrane protein
MSHKRKILQGSASNVTRVLLSMLVSLVLPPFLVRHMSAAEYSAWVLILQLTAYVNLLDFGLQTAIGKFVAEYEASGDRDASHNLVSTSFTFLAVAAAIACVAIAVMVYFVPSLFEQMPGELVPKVRIALFATGTAAAIALPFTAFLSTFIGLQEYVFPTVVATASRVGSAVALIVLLLLHATLVQLAMVMATVNLASAATQYLGWRKLARDRVAFSFLLFHRASAVKLAKYGSVLSIWTLAMLLISGLDVVIVGHFHYGETGYYSIANGAANFMLALVGSAFGPLIPAISSIQSGTTPERIGGLCIRATRYCVLLLLFLGLPLIFGAYPLLTLWARHSYASRSARYLEVLVLANIIRQLAFPYVLAVVATGRQHLTTLAGIVEAAVNICLSIWLVQKLGAIGVAIGTLGGAFIGVTMHLLVSMPRTQPTIFMQRRHYLLRGVIRPLLGAIPSLLLYPFWNRFSLLPANPWLLAAWAVSSLWIGWQIGLTQEDRAAAVGGLSRLVHFRGSKGD